MKILQVCNKVPYPLKDGGALAIHNLIKGFADSGSEITLLAMNTSKHKAAGSEVNSYFKKLNNVLVELVDVNTDTKLTGALKNLFFSKLPYNAERFISDNFRTKLESLLKAENFDVVQFEGLYLMPYINTVREYSGAKVVLRAHNVEHEIWQRNLSYQSNMLKKAYLSIIARRLRNFEYQNINKYDILIPITRRDACKFNEMGNTKPMLVCPYAFDPDNLKAPEFIHQPDTFFYIGSLDWLPNQQGIKWFVRNVWNRISAEIKGAKFFVAGRNAPQGLINYLQKQNIIFSGEVEDAYAFIRDKSVMVVPLFSGSGMRVKIVEAMAAGKAVITTSLGAEGIDLTNNENIILADSADDFLVAAKKLCTNNDFYLHIAKNAVKFVSEQLNNKIVVSKLLEFYKASIV